MGRAQFDAGVNGLRCLEMCSRAFDIYSQTKLAAKTKEKMEK